jgi:hypothetical protein
MTLGQGEVTPGRSPAPALAHFLDYSRNLRRQCSVTRHGATIDRQQLPQLAIVQLMARLGWACRAMPVWAVSALRRRPPVRPQISIAATSSTRQDWRVIPKPPDPMRGPIDGNNNRRFYALLHLGGICSSLDAMRAPIVAERRQ